MLFHELAHSIVAKHYQIKVRKIVLYPIGGVSEIEEIPGNSSIEWRLAISGPVLSLAVGAVLLGVNQLLNAPSISAISAYLLNISNFLLDLALLNLLLGFFNLIPALPLDGGRVFRALLSKKMDYAKATKYAAYLGRIFGIIFIIAGFLYNLWLILIGIFVYVGASEESQQAATVTALGKLRVRDLMQSEFKAVNSEQNIEDVLQDMFQHGYQEIVVEKDGSLQGILSWNELTKVGPEQRRHTKVEILPLKKGSAFEDTSVLEASKIMSIGNMGLLPVVMKDAPVRIVGVLTKARIDALLNRSQT